MENASCYRLLTRAAQQLSVRVAPLSRNPTLRSTWLGQGTQRGPGGPPHTKPRIIAGGTLTAFGLRQIPQRLRQTLCEESQVSAFSRWRSQSCYP